VGQVSVWPVDRNLGCVFLDIVLQMFPHRDQISMVGAFKILFDSALETAATKSPYIIYKLGVGTLVRKLQTT